MKHLPFAPSILTACLLLNLITLPLSAEDTSLKEDLAKLQGKWKTSLTTGQGSSVWTLEIKGNKSIIVVASLAGDELFKGETDFKLEQHGAFRAYTYSNLKNLAPRQDQPAQITNGKTKSSIYRLDADSFTTVGGFRSDDTDKPVLLKWEKVVETKK